jgi:hypothetical protein
VFIRELIRPDGYPVRTWTWAEAVARLDGFEGTSLKPMRDFMGQIAASPYAESLFTAPSMNAVLVGRIPNFPGYEPHLRMEYNRRTRAVEFSYVVDPYSQQIWRTQAPIARAFTHFEHLMQRRLRWFRKQPHGSNKSLERTREG